MNFSFFKSFLKRKKRFQNTTNFPFDIESKQRQFKNNTKIIINQIDLGWLICNFFLDFKHIMMVDYNASKRLVAITLVQNTIIHNKKKKIHNYLKCVM